LWKQYRDVYFIFLSLSNPSQARIIGFEPGKNAFKVLLENVRRNNLSDVDVYNKACANKDGTITFFTDSSNQGCTRMNMMEKTHGCTTFDTIECVKLSPFVDRPVDLLKIDVEGAEYMILEELASTGKLALINNMIIEYHHHLFNPSEDKLSSFLKILEDNNFGYQLSVDGGDHTQPREAQYPMIYAYKK